MKRIRDNSATKNSHLFAYADLEFAKIDFSRERRQNFPEAVYCPGKTINQIIKIVDTLRKRNNLVILTHVERRTYQAVKKKFPQARYYPQARLIALLKRPISHIPHPTSKSFIAVITAGTSDIPVAEEAAVTAEALGSRVERIYDVGVAGVHRLFKHQKKILPASVAIVCAGMEGALPSIVGGLVAYPVVGVPTSIGYGGNFQGLTALFTILNSCAANVCCVNIDDGFGAGVIAHLINNKTRMSTDKSPDCHGYKNLRKSGC